MFDSILNHRSSSLYGTFDRLRRELDDVFGSSSAFAGNIRSVAPGTLPAVNVGRTPRSIEVFAFAPGLDAGKIEVTLDRGVLRIAGERAPATPRAGDDGHPTTGDTRPHAYARERGVGRFSRTVALPDDIDPSQIDARYRDGVLQVSIARREAARPQRIDVQ